MNLTYSPNGRVPTFTRVLSTGYALESSSGRVTAQKEISKEFGIRLEAVNIRQERTGIHAKVGIYLTHGNGAKLLAWNNFNIERSEDRSRLAHNAHDTMRHASPSAAECIEKVSLKNHLDIYAAGLWTDYLEPLAAQPVKGDSMGTEQVFLARPLVLRGGGTIAFSPPGRGKSFTAMVLAVSIDSGTDTFWPTTKTRTMLINLERSGESIQRRLGSVNTALGLDPDRPLIILNARGKSLAQIADIARTSIERHEVGFVALDSISRAGLGDLTENRPVNAIIDTLSDLCESWLALAHTPRGDESHVYGGVHFDAGADIMVKLLTDSSPERLGIGLQVTKANDIGPQPMMVLSYGFDEYGLNSVELSKASAFPGLVEAQAVSTPDAICEYLMNEVGTATASQIAAELGKGRANISRLLTSDKRFQRVNRVGREVYYGVKV